MCHCNQRHSEVRPLFRRHRRVELGHDAVGGSCRRADAKAREILGAMSLFEGEFATAGFGG